MRRLAIQDYKCFAATASLSKLPLGFETMTKLQRLDQDELIEKEVAIRNIAAELDLEIELDLSYLSSEIEYSSYEPERYPSLIFRPPNLPTVLITKTGKLLFPGGSSVESIIDAYYTTVQELEDLGIKDIRGVEDLRVVNLVSTFQSEERLDLPELSIRIGLENVEYEPEQFPALIYRVEPDSVALIFSSGNVVITGATSCKEVLTAAQNVRDVVSG
jgi:transcription initiation factor TFIID TATA-box-binding protein